MTFLLTADTPVHSFRLDLTPQSVLDVGDAIFHGVNVAPGSAVPSDGDPRIDRALPGFLFTCGPDHIRHPVPIEGASDGRRYPLHGSLSSHPAQDILIEEDEGEIACEGRIPVALAHGGRAELTRRWRADRRTGHITLDDTITNTGETAWPRFGMYHINFGTGLFDENTRLTGAMLPGGSLPWRFDEGDMKIFCVPAAETAATRHCCRAVRRNRNRSRQPPALPGRALPGRALPGQPAAPAWPLRVQQAAPMLPAQSIPWPLAPASLRPGRTARRAHRSGGRRWRTSPWPRRRGRRYPWTVPAAERRVCRARSSAP